MLQSYKLMLVLAFIGIQFSYGDYYPLGEGDSWEYKEQITAWDNSTEQWGEPSTQYHLQLVAGQEPQGPAQMLFNYYDDVSPESEEFSSRARDTSYITKHGKQVLSRFSDWRTQINEDITVFDFNLAAGDSMTIIDFDSTIRISGMEFEVRFTMDAYVLDAEDITTPAGEFSQCYKQLVVSHFTYGRSGMGADMEQMDSTYMYLANDVGIVKTEESFSDSSIMGYVARQTVSELQFYGPLRAVLPTSVEKNILAQNSPINIIKMGSRGYLAVSLNPKLANSVAQLEVFGIKGQILGTYTLESNNGFSARVFLGDKAGRAFEPGMYFFRIRQEDKNWARKFLLRP